MTDRIVLNITQRVIAATLLLVLCSCQHASTPTASPVAAASAKPAIQTKAIVFDLADPDGTTSVGIMAAFDPLSHSFWWRPVPMIAAPEMLESYFDRCKFERDGVFVVNLCVRGNEVVVTTTADHAASLENGLQDAQEKLKREPGLLMGYQGPHDIGFDLQHKAGVDMNTPEGVPPTVVRSAESTGSGWRVEVTCGCGDALVLLNRYYDFIGFKRI